jgi:hypothetical protein
MVSREDHERHPEGVAELRKARRRLSKWLGWLAGLFVTALVTAVAGHIVDGWFTTTPSQSPKTRFTQVRLMQPFNMYGKLLAPYKSAVTLHGGSCINSAESSDPDALRCFSSDQVADPCWRAANGSGGVNVACLASPWDTRAIMIVDPHINAMARASIGPVPWALKIIQPSHPGRNLDCGFVGGTAQVIAGMRANWACFKPSQVNQRGLAGYAIGTPQIASGKPWTVFYVAINSSQAVEATVTTVWR